MAPPADVLYVAASIGEVDGQNQLRMVAVDAQHPSVAQTPLPPERQAGTLPICDLTFAQTPVLEEGVFDADAYTTYIKPFRLVEDVFSTLAMQIALFALGAKTGLGHAQREDLLGLIAQGEVIAAGAMSSDAEMLLITAYLRASQAHWASMADGWANAAPEVRPHWQVERPILTVAAKARAQRRASAWQALSEALPEGSPAG